MSFCVIFKRVDANIDNSEHRMTFLFISELFWLFKSLYCQWIQWIIAWQWLKKLLYSL